MHVAHQLHDLSPRSREVDVPDVELFPKLGAAVDHAFQECAVGAVVPLALVVAGAVGESGVSRKRMSI
jgi:hypothetical protein